MVDDLLLLGARLAVGLGLAAHGAQKAYGWFEGPGPDGAAGFFESVGFKPGKAMAEAAAYDEIVAGLLIAVGLGGPIGPAALIANQAVAGTSVHAKNGFFAADGGVEVNVLYSAAALAFASKGYGRLSLDAVIGAEKTLHHPVLKTLGLAAALAGAYAILGQRDLGPPPGTLATPTVSGREANGTSAPQPAKS